MAPATPPNGLTWRSYYYAGGQRVAMREQTATTNVVYYLHADHLGSASLVTCGNASGCGSVPSGDIVGQMRYTPYGETRSGYPIGNVPTDRRFTGQAQEESLGLYFYNARWYDPALGRFLSADTLVPQPGNPQSLNRYSYVLNNPKCVT
jgi:RHS repeat-associated protein